MIVRVDPRAQEALDRALEGTGLTIQTATQALAAEKGEWAPWSGGDVARLLVEMLDREGFAITRKAV
jgi:hypothetical protein